LLALKKSNGPCAEIKSRPIKDKPTRPEMKEENLQRGGAMPAQMTDDGAQWPHRREWAKSPAKKGEKFVRPACDPKWLTAKRMRA